MQLFETLLHDIKHGKNSSRNAVYTACLSLLNKEDSIIKMQFALILYGLEVKGATKDEILGLVDFLYHMQPNLKPENKIRVDDNVILLAGSGKKGLKTFNISTAAGLLASFMGAKVAKTSSKATSSLTGSSDILELIGANINIPTENMIDILQDLGFGVFPIESEIPLFDSIYGGNFYTTHAFSYVLPSLLNPIKANKVVYGLSADNVTLSAEIIREIGLFDEGMVVSSFRDNKYIDELIPLLESRFIRFKSNDRGDLKVNLLSKDLEGDIIEISPKSNYHSQKEDFLNVIAGNASNVKLKTVAYNAASICMLDKDDDFKKMYQKCYDTLKSGVLAKHLNNFIERTNSYGRK